MRTNYLFELLLDGSALMFVVVFIYLGCQIDDKGCEILSMSRLCRENLKFLDLTSEFAFNNQPTTSFA
jgi:hypothetical protein